MIRRRLLLIFTGLTAGAFGSRLARAADPAQRVVRLGLVGPDWPATVPPSATAFWEHLREPGWIEGQSTAGSRLNVADRLTSGQ